MLRTRESRFPLFEGRVPALTLRFTQPQFGGSSSEVVWISRKLWQSKAKQVEYVTQRVERSVCRVHQTPFHTVAAEQLGHPLGLLNMGTRAPTLSWHEAKYGGVLGNVFAFGQRLSQGVWLRGTQVAAD